MQLPKPCILAPLWIAICSDAAVYCVVLCCRLTDCTDASLCHSFPLAPHRGPCCPIQPACLAHPCARLFHIHVCIMLPDLFVMQPPAKRSGASTCSAPYGSAHHNKCPWLASPLPGFRYHAGCQVMCCHAKDSLVTPYVSDGLWECKQKQPQHIGMSRPECLVRLPTTPVAPSRQPLHSSKLQLMPNIQRQTLYVYKQ